MEHGPLPAQGVPSWGKGKKITLGIVMFFIAIFALGGVSVYTASDEQKTQWAAERVEEKAEQETQWSADRDQEEWERIAAQKQAERDAYQQQLKEDYFERTGKNLDDFGESECEFDINWKQHTQTIYKTMSEPQYCQEFRDQLKLACQPEAKKWWTSMLVIWEC